MDGWTDRKTDGWIDRQTDGWMYGWTDRSDRQKDSVQCMCCS